MRFLLIDDHALFRFGLRALLMSLPGGHEVTEVASCEAALALDAAAVAPDVVVLDLTLPGIQGLEGLERLRAWHPPAAIVVMSAAEGPEWAVEGLRRGARGFIPKSLAPEAMVQALEQVMRGGVYVPVLDTPGAVQRNGVELTPRQRQVLGLLIQNCPNKVIAQTLDMSVNTVRVHVAAIFRALDVDNRVDAARIAIAQGLIDGR